ncbi:amino acid adenylation domain-containing protein [Actinomadura welshii]
MIETTGRPASADAALDSLVAPPSAAPAVVHRGTALDYAALHGRAGGIAAELRRRGAAGGDPVGVCAADAFRLVPAIVGILKAGCAYVPFDPSWPTARIASAAGRIGLRHVVTDEETAADLGGTGLDLIRTDRLPEADAPAPAGATGSAYMILTSGSTGEPKAVAVGHRAAVQSLLARRTVYRRTVRAFLWHSPSAFDSSVAGLFWTLADAGTLVVPAPSERTDPARLLDLVRRHGVSHVLCLPRVWREVLRTARPGDLRDVETVIVAGEAVPPGLLAEHTAACAAELWNEYGPAEAAVWSTVHRCDPAGQSGGHSGGGAGTVPIGRPRPGAEARVVRPDLTECEPGEEGEILLSGEALAWGYTGAPGLTAERFVPSPFAAGRRAYRTGDLAVRRADGALEFRGRADDEIKVSGIRVAPAEVERAMLAVPGVAEAAVVARPAGQGRVTLAGYVVPDGSGGPTPGGVRAALGEILPAVMVPAVIEVVPGLPRGATGKVDRAALAARPPEAEPEPAPTTAGTAPGTGGPLDEVLAVWRAVLRDDALPADADLFAAGGDSISAVVICAQLRERGLTADPFEVFRERTPRGLAAMLGDRPRAETAPPTAAPSTTGPDSPRPDGGDARPDRAVSPWIPLTPVQRWFVASYPDALDHWNFSVGLTVERGDPDLVRAALTEVADRHAMLAAAFECAGPPADPASWRCRPGGGAVPLTWEFLDGDLDGPEADGRIEEWQRSLRLCGGPVARLLWLESRRAPGRARAVLIAHHMVTDAVSTRIVLADLATEIARRRGGPAAAPPGPAPHVGDWVREQDARLARGARAGETEHWARTAAAAASPLVDADPGTEGTARRTVGRVGGAVAAAFESAARDRPRAAEEILLAALAGAVRAEPGAPRALGIELESAGRTEASAAAVGAVGWFTAFYPVVVDLDGAADAPAARAAARAALSAVPGEGAGFLALAHGPQAPGEVPGQAPGQGLASVPAPPVGLNYLGRVASRLDLGDVRIGLDPAPPGTRAAAAPRRHVLDLDAFLYGGELILAWTHPAAGPAAEYAGRLAARVAEGIGACLDMEVSDVR